MARPGQRGSGRARTDPGAQRRRAPRPAEQGIIPVLAEVAREVDRAVQRPPTRPAVRTKFQVVALLVREERARVMADAALSASRRTEQLKRLDGVATHAGQDRRPGHLAARAARRGRPGLRRGARLQGDADARRRAGAAGGARARRAGRAGAPRAATAGGAAVGDLAPAGEPVPGPGLRGRGRADRDAGPPAGRLGAARAAVPVLRAGRDRRTRLHGAARAPAGAHARRPGADAAPGPGRRGDGRRPPHVPARRRARASARPPRRCSPRRRPTPTRCWSSCPTSSRRTGRTRSGCGRRSAGPRWSTATATGWTGSRTS